MIIAITALKEKIRRKELYIVSVIGVLILLIFGTGTGSLSINGAAVTDYKMLAPIFLIVVNAISCVLSFIMSLSTIPNEYERNTSHLVWVRKVSQARYHGELALANFFVGLASEAILFMAMFIFVLTQGRVGEAWRLLPAYLLVGMNIAIVTLLTSMLTVIVPKIPAGAIAAAVVLCGIFHSMLDIAKDMLGGFGAELINCMLKIVPDLHEIQSQAGNILCGDKVDAHVIWVGLFYIYIFAVLLMVVKRKEA